MGKPANPSRIAENEAKAFDPMIRTSPRKLNLVAQLIRNMDASRAVAELTGVELAEGPYETVAGYVVAVLGALPEVGSQVAAGEHRLTVAELDGHRASRIRVTAPAPAAPTGEEDGAARMGDSRP